MNFEQIEKDFDKKFKTSEYLDEVLTIFYPQKNGSSLTAYTTQRSEIKQFYRQKMKEWALEMIGDDTTGEGNADEQQFSFGFVSGYNQRGEEIRERIKQEIPE